MYAVYSEPNASLRYISSREMTVLTRIRRTIGSRTIGHAAEIGDSKSCVHGIASKAIRTVGHKLTRTMVRVNCGFGAPERHHSPPDEDEADRQRTPPERFER